ncbi:hypothetical protein D9M70_481780 [compost metagenome]
MGEDALLLQVQLRVVDHQRHHEAEHEQHRRIHQPRHQRHHHRDHQQQVEPDELRPLVRVIGQDDLDVAIVTAGFQVGVANPLQFFAPENVGGEHHPEGAAHHGWQHGNEVLTGVQAKHGDGSCSRTAPRAHAAHDAQRQHGYTGEDQRVHANALV